MVSLPNFNNTASEVKTATDVWLYLLKNAGTEKDIPNFGSSIVDEALERIRVDNLDDEMLKKVEMDMIAQEEIDCRLAGARIQGLKEGQEKGRKETLLEVVDALLANGKLNDEDIAAITNVPLDEIHSRRTSR